VLKILDKTKKWWVEMLETKHHWMEELEEPAPLKVMARLTKNKGVVNLVHLIQQKKCKDGQLKQRW
jgi:ribosomal protein L28